MTKFTVKSAKHKVQKCINTIIKIIKPDSLTIGINWPFILSGTWQEKDPSTTSTIIITAENTKDIIAQTFLPIITDSKTQYPDIAEKLRLDAIKSMKGKPEQLHKQAEEIYNTLFSPNNNNTDTDINVEVSDIETLFQNIIDGRILNEYSLLLNNYAFFFAFKDKPQKNMPNIDILVKKFVPFFPASYTTIPKKIKYTSLEDENILDNVLKIYFTNSNKSFALNSMYYLGDNWGDTAQHHYMCFVVSTNMSSCNFQLQFKGYFQNAKSIAQRDLESKQKIQQQNQEIISLDNKFFINMIVMTIHKCGNACPAIVSYKYSETTNAKHEYTTNMQEDRLTSTISNDFNMHAIYLDINKIFLYNRLSGLTEQKPKVKLADNIKDSIGKFYMPSNPEKDKCMDAFLSFLKAAFVCYDKAIDVNKIDKNTVKLMKSTSKNSSKVSQYTSFEL